ncbi:MAG: FxsA family protein [Micropruina sp.]
MTYPTTPGARRRPWLLPLILVGFIAVPILEVWLLTVVGTQIGLLPTVGILIAEAALGAWLMRREGAKAWKALQDSFNSGKMPAGELADAALVLVGGVLLMLPGFFTDVIGLLFLLPFTRPLARALIGFVIARQVAKSGVDLSAMRVRMDRSTVIEGETVPDPSPNSPKPSDPNTVIKGEVEP